MTARRTRKTQRSNPRQRRAWWFIGGGLIAAVALLVGLTFAFSGPQEPETELASANPAPDMTLATLSGDFQLSENQGEVLVLYFSFPG